jgi:hypothetical protein
VSYYVLARHTLRPYGSMADKIGLNLVFDAGNFLTWTLPHES